MRAKVTNISHTNIQNGAEWKRLRTHGDVWLFDGRCKLIDTLGFQELYDLDVDSKESTNIAPKNPAIVAKLQTVMNGYGRKALPPLRLGRRSDG